MAGILDYSKEELDNIFNWSPSEFVEEYPGKVREQARLGFETISRSPVFAGSQGGGQVALSVVTPLLDKFKEQFESLIASSIDKGILGYGFPGGGSFGKRFEGSGEQLAAPIALAGSLMRGRWFSPSIMAVLKAKQKKASGRQWLAELGREGGAPLREIKEMDVLASPLASVSQRKSVGFEEFLQTHQGTLSSEDMVRLLKERQIPLQEDVLRQSRVPSDPMYLEDAKEFYGIEDIVWDNLLPRQKQAYFDELRDDIASGRLRPRQFFDDTRYADDHTLNLQIESPHNYKEILIRMPKGSLSRTWQDSHYPDHENVIVNIRVNEGLIKGDKSLILQEVESTLHQKAAGLRRKHVVSVSQKQKISLEEAEELVPQDWAYVPDENGRIRVPNAPFKKTWHQLGFKRALMEALKDPTIKRFVWTDANTQSIRANDVDWEQNAEAIELHKLFSDLYDKKLVQFSKKFLKQVPEKVSSDLVGREDEWIIASKDDGYLSNREVGEMVNPDSIITFDNEQDAVDFLNSPETDHLGLEWRVDQMGLGKNLKSLDLDKIRERFKVKMLGPTKAGEYLIHMPLTTQKERDGLLESYA